MARRKAAGAAAGRLRQPQVRSREEPEVQVKKKKNFVSAFPVPSCILHKYMV